MNINVGRSLIAFIAMALLLFISKMGLAQNLVPNPSFELYDTCPNTTMDGTIQYATGWFQPCAQYNSSDYFNSCSFVSDRSVPHQMWTGSFCNSYQLPHSGNAYVGIGLFAFIPQLGLNTNYREYIEIKLMDSLKAGQKYCVSYFVSLVNCSNYYVSDIQAFFTKDSLIDHFTALGPIQVAPQIQSDTTVFLSDTSGWMAVVDSFIAIGGEQFITIGNFKNDSSTHFNPTGVVGFANVVAYYYIDDVSVVLCDSQASVMEKNILNFSIDPNPASELVKIKMPEGLTGRLIVFDVAGRTMKSFEMQGKQSMFELDVSDLPQGVYVLQLLNEEKRGQKRFVKM